MWLNLHHRLTPEKWVYRKEEIPLSNRLLVIDRLTTISNEISLSEISSLRSGATIYARHKYALGAGNHPQFQQYTFVAPELSAAPYCTATALLFLHAGSQEVQGYICVRDSSGSLLLNVASFSGMLECRSKGGDSGFEFILRDSMTSTKVSFSTPNQKISMRCELPARKYDSGTMPIAVPVMVSGSPIGTIHFRHLPFITKHFGLLNFLMGRVPAFTNTRLLDDSTDADSVLFLRAVFLFLSCACICYRPTEPHTSL
jgi:hypothetical protein